MLLRVAQEALAACKDPGADLEQSLARIQDMKLPARPSAGLRLQGWDDLEEAADAQVDDWLIPNWAEFGCLHLLCGQPFAGKSTHVAELIALISQRRNWHGGLPLAQVPVLLLDFENRERTLRDRIANYLGDDRGRIRDILYRVPAADLPRPLTPETIRHLIAILGDRIGEPHARKGLVIIDTFRTAFGDSEAFDENDQSSTGRLMRPLKALAQETGWAVLLLHHNAKSTDRYSGAGTIAAIADYMWTWRVDKEKLTGTLSCEGRADAVPPLQFAYSLSERRNVFLGTPTAVKARAAEEGEAKEDLRVLGAFGGATCEETAITAMRVGERLVVTDRTARKKCEDLHAGGLLLRSGEGRRGNQYRYWLSEEGRRRLFVDSVAADSRGEERP